jgi:hypothetical protein
VSPVRAIPTSRAYWELRAEQMLNRVFAPEAPIDVEVSETTSATRDTSSATSRRERTAARSAPAARPRQPRASATAIPDTWVLVGTSVLVTLTSGFTLLGLSLWNQSQQAMRQERSMLLVERLRAMGPAAAPPAPELGSIGQAIPSGQLLPEASGVDGLPPPPLEPWMEELATLPASSAPPTQVLQVPMSSRVGSPAPPASATARASSPAPPQQAKPAAPAPANLPQLVGVVQVPGRPAAAIFQLDGSSTSAATGESIGNSGWRLHSASGDSAVIERDGVQQRISISSGF